MDSCKKLLTENFRRPHLKNPQTRKKLKNMTSLDNHGQPLNIRFNFTRNAEKAAWSLMGILKGISADGKLNGAELLFLNEWLRAQKNLQDDGDLVDLIDLIDDILADGVIETDELEELYSLTDDIITYRTMDSNSAPKHAVNQLLGIINGMLADDQLKDEEIVRLQGWLDDQPELENHSIVAPILRNVEEILEDNVITEEERDNLKTVLTEVSGFNFTETGCAECLSFSFIEDTEEFIPLEANTFCLTGKFLAGGRNKLKQKISSLGGNTSDNVTRKVHYLVIGTLASRDWRCTSAGSKIEKALTLKANGHSIKIISEETWSKSIQNLTDVKVD